MVFMPRTGLFKFFDDEVPLAEKRKMIRNLKNPNNLPRQVSAKIDDQTCVEKLKFSDFGNKSNLNFFNIIEFEPLFLKSDPKSWPEYLKCQELCNNITDVNDLAERGVALGETFW